MMPIDVVSPSSRARRLIVLASSGLRMPRRAPCSDAESTILLCSPSVVTSGEGALTASGMARDAAGQTSLVIVPVKVDKTAPFVSVFDPDEGSTVPPETTTITVRGFVTEALSGLASITCGGTPAAVVGDAFTCTVAVNAGANVISVEARDRAGHLTTRTLNVTNGELPPAASIEITPGTLTLIAGERRSLLVTDDQARRVHFATWTVSDPVVAEVTEADQVISVRALAAGEATLTATHNGLSAWATVTVLPADETTAGGLPTGTTVWSLQGTTVPPRGQVLRAVPEEGESGPDAPALFFVDEGTSRNGRNLVRLFNRPTHIRATTLDGRQLWQRRFTDRIAKHFAADNHGGIVMVFDSFRNSSNVQIPAMVRRINPAGGVSWEYHTFNLLSEVAVHPDGRIFVTESPIFIRGGDRVYLVAIAPDGLVQKWDIPTGTFVQIDSGFFGLNEEGENAPKASGPIVREDGTVVLVSRRRDTVEYVFSFEENGTIKVRDDPSNPDSAEGHVDLLELRPGETSLSSHAVDTAPTTTVDYSTYRVIPDGRGGLLLGNTQAAQVHRIFEASPPSGGYVRSPDTLLLNGDYPWVEYVLGEDVAYAMALGTASGPTPHIANIVAFDPVTLTTTSAPLGFPRAQPAQLQLQFAIRGGGAYISGPAEAYVVNASISADQFSDDGNASQAVLGTWSGWESNRVELVVGGVDVVGSTPWPYRSGDAQSANRGRITYPTIDAAAVAVLRKYNPFSTLRNREYGGSICVSGPRFFASEPAINVEFSDSVIPSSCPTGIDWVGRYHTHGAEGGATFSSQDRANADANPGKAWYVATPCGDIDKYVGPNFTIYHRLTEKTDTWRTCIP